MTQEIKSMIRPEDCRRLFSPDTRVSAAAQALVATQDYPTFQKAYSVENENYCAANVEKAVTVNSPMLDVAAEAYGEEMMVKWTYLHLAGIAMGTGVRKGEEALVNQLLSLARTIIYNYPKLRVTALMLFFARFKAGFYGQFYGSFDPLVVTSALNEFVGWARQERWAAMERAMRGNV